MINWVMPVISIIICNNIIILSSNIILLIIIIIILLVSTFILIINIMIMAKINRLQMPACTMDTNQLLQITRLPMASIPGLLSFNLKMEKDEDARNSPPSESQSKIEIQSWPGLPTAPRSQP